MIPYILFIFLMFFLLCCVKKEKNTIYDYFVIIIMMLFCGLRYNVGTDYGLYENLYFNVFSLQSDFIRTGYGYYLISKCVASIFPNSVNILYLLISIITTINIYVFCKKNSRNPGLAIYIYICLGFYLSSFNMFRQMLSVSCILMALTLWNEEKYKRSIVLYIFAVLIHKVALLAILAISFVKILNKNLNAIILCILGIIGVLCYDVIYDFIINNISSMRIYAVDDEYMPGIGTFVQIFLYFCFYFIINLNKNKIIDGDIKKKEYINLFSLSFIIMMFGMKNILFMRVANYLNIFIIVVIPELYYLYGLKNKRIEKLIMYSFFTCHYFIHLVSFNDMLPYNSIL